MTYTFDEIEKRYNAYELELSQQKSWRIPDDGRTQYEEEKQRNNGINIFEKALLDMDKMINNFKKTFLETFPEF